MQGLPVLGIFVRSSRRDGAGTRVQRRQGVEPGAPTARSVETAVTRVSKQQRRGRAGGFDDDVRRDAQICRGGQAVLAVEIEVPGSWFGAGPMGALNASERREKYTAQAVEYAEVREFPGASRGTRNTKEQAIRFI